MKYWVWVWKQLLHKFFPIMFDRKFHYWPIKGESFASFFKFGVLVWDWYGPNRFCCNLGNYQGFFDWFSSLHFLKVLVWDKRPSYWTWSLRRRMGAWKRHSAKMLKFQQHLQNSANFKFEMLQILQTFSIVELLGTLDGPKSRSEALLESRPYLLNIFQNS